MKGFFLYKYIYIEREKSDSKEFIKQTGADLAGLVMVLLYVLDRINDDHLYKYKLGNMYKADNFFSHRGTCTLLSMTEPN